LSLVSIRRCKITHFFASSQPWESKKWSISLVSFPQSALYQPFRESVKTQKSGRCIEVYFPHFSPFSALFRPSPTAAPCHLFSAFRPIPPVASPETLRQLAEVVVEEVDVAQGDEHGVDEAEEPVAVAEPELGHTDIEVDQVDEDGRCEPEEGDPYRLNSQTTVARGDETDESGRQHDERQQQQLCHQQPYVTERDSFHRCKDTHNS